MKQIPGFTRNDLARFKPEHDFFVGIDSDGCVFPTMELKQKKCFHRVIIRHWKLQEIEKHLRETAEFVNLYSIYRGRNRFVNLLLTFDLLRRRPEVAAAKVKLPELKSLKNFIASGAPLSNAELARAVKNSGDEELRSVLQWSRKINAVVAATVKNVRPFRWAVKSLRKIKKNADVICVSQTPATALAREWKEHNLTDFVRVIAGQELGTKAEHIRLAAGNRYGRDKILMIGDAPGDRRAAAENHACFYPVNPGREEESWKRFYKESFGKFLDGTYGGDYENRLIRQFEKFLPAAPKWKSKNLRK
ncbi:MAG: HAD family hydrolase [Kiritimatiellae bacterium]|nr:HAD family hydrolase [Kiritimatiellia bacterium]